MDNPLVYAWKYLVFCVRFKRVPFLRCPGYGGPDECRWWCRYAARRA